MFWSWHRLELVTSQSFTDTLLYQSRKLNPYQPTNKETPVTKVPPIPISTLDVKNNKFFCKKAKLILKQKQKQVLHFVNLIIRMELEKNVT